MGGGAAMLLSVVERGCAGRGGVPNCDANIIPLSVVCCRKFN